MKMKRWKSSLLAGLLLVGAAGCATRPAGIAPSSEPLTPGQYTEIGPAMGKSRSFTLLFLPLTQASTQAALRDALRTSGGDALVRVSVESRDYPCILFYIHDTRVEGTAVRKVN